MQFPASHATRTHSHRTSAPLDVTPAGFVILDDSRLLGRLSRDFSLWTRMLAGRDADGRAAREERVSQRKVPWARVDRGSVIEFLWRGVKSVVHGGLDRIDTFLLGLAQWQCSDGGMVGW